ncbi:hypothetical protein J2805_003709 [Arthrobacter oryzae]|nr:hypothetical protein [Arthrobacter oryzae]
MPAALAAASPSTAPALGSYAQIFLSVPVNEAL